MKIAPLLILITLGLSFISLSCHKSNNNTVNGTSDSTAIISKWSLVSDSLLNTNNYYTPSQGIPFSGKYLGGPADYWNFQQNGIVYMHEEGMQANFAYQLLPNSRMAILGKTEMIKSVVTGLTAHFVTITGRDTSGNGGTVIETVILTR